MPTLCADVMDWSTDQKFVLKGSVTLNITDYIKTHQKCSLSNLEVFGSNKAQVGWNPLIDPHFDNISNN